MEAEKGQKEEASKICQFNGVRNLSSKSKSVIENVWAKMSLIDLDYFENLDRTKTALLVNKS